VSHHCSVPEEYEELKWDSSEVHKRVTTFLAWYKAQACEAEHYTAGTNNEVFVCLVITHIKIIQIISTC
jgi:hypothetical protein